MAIKCCVDRCDQTLIEGWIVDPATPGMALSVALMLDDMPLALAKADRFRPDLRHAGFGDCAFSIPTPEGLDRDQVRRLRLVLHGSDLSLPMPRPPAASWLDEPDWFARLASRHRAGDLDDAMADRLCRFRRDGYLPLPAALPPDTVGKALDALRDAWSASGSEMESFEPDGHPRQRPANARARRERSRLLDPHRRASALMEAARPSILIETLRALFGEPPALVSSHAPGEGWRPLGPDREIAHQIPSGHRCGAVLALAPMEGFAACPGSHLAPDYLFGGDTPAMRGHEAEYPRFQAAIEAEARRAGRPVWSLTLAPGDVLLIHPRLTRRTEPGPAWKAWLELAYAASTDAGPDVERPSAANPS